MPVSHRIDVFVPPWVWDVEDDSSRLSLEMFFTTVAFARARGADRNAECRELLAQAAAQLPSREEIETASEDALAGVCARINAADRLAERANSQAQRRKARE
jgi:hypothetical protein